MLTKPTPLSRFPACQMLILVLMTVLTLGLVWPSAGGAQSVLSVATGATSGTKTDATDDTASGTGTSAAVQDALKQIESTGRGVVVIDASGNVVVTGTGTDGTGASASEDADDHMTASSSLMNAQTSIRAFRDKLEERFQVLPNSFAEVTFILRATSPDRRIMTFVETLGWLLAFLAAGMVFTRFVYGPKIAARFVIPRVRENPEGYREKMPFLFYRFCAGVVGTLLTIVIVLILSIFIPYIDDLAIQFTVLAVLTAFALARTVSDMWRMLLSPFLPQYRILSLGDRDAKKLYRWFWIFASLNIAGGLFSTWIKDFGLNYNVYALIFGFVTLLSVIGGILLVLFNGRAISNAIRNGRNPAEVSWLLRFLSYAWAPVLIGYFIFSWLELSFDLVMEQPTSIAPVTGVFSTFLAIIVVYGFINYMIETYFSRQRDIERLNDEMAQADAQEDRADREADAIDAIKLDDIPTYTILTYEELARRVAGLLAFVAGGIALILIWDTRGALANSDGFEKAIDVIVILFIGYILYNFFRIWIDSKIAEEVSDVGEAEPGDEGGGHNSATRLATLLPLFRGAILAIVVVTIALIALFELGVNVSPLFAGAGVVGLAVGFGAQTLVRDIFSGAFFLFDDAFRKGEYIDIGMVKGTVEKISVRSFQLRHHLGALHTIPFGEIQVLTNYSRDWVIMKLPLRVTYDTDVERVRKLIKNLGKELLSDPVIGDNFIQPLKSQGVIEMQDSAMIIRVKFMTKPGDQWLVRKKVYEEIRQLFEREGIRFAHREVTVRLADEHAEDLTPKQKETVVGAVQAAIDEDAFDGINDAE
ncbi:MAG: mechanosensitive ion channel [Marinibacterium sp.]|nr:mechanosensitive ion channel [Marinibacterium sp.]